MILPRFWILKSVIFFVVIYAGETSVSKPSAISQTCNSLLSSILMIYNLASTTMLPGLKIKSKDYTYW